MNEVTTNAEFETERINDANGYGSPVDEDIMLPDGWADGDDVFDPDSWGTGSKSGGSETDDQAEEAEGEDADTDGAPTIETAESEQTDDANPEEEADAAEADGKIRFTVKVDHKEQEIDLAREDLPAIYQKAQVVDRLQRRADAAQQRLDNGERLARIMGYKDMEEMLSAAETNFREAEIERLMNGGISDKSVAEDMLTSKWEKFGAKKDIPAEAVAEAEAPRTVPGAKPQDVYLNEVAELFTSHPELNGQKLPDEVVRAAIFNGKTVTEAYEEYAGRRATAENKKLKKENKVLRQNAASAAKAPVRGATTGGSTGSQAPDPLFVGFDSYDW